MGAVKDALCAPHGGDPGKAGVVLDGPQNPKTIEQRLCVRRSRHQSLSLTQVLNLDLTMNPALGLKAKQRLDGFDVKDFVNSRVNSYGQTRQVTSSRLNKSLGALLAALAVYGCSEQNNSVCQFEQAALGELQGAQKLAEKCAYRTAYQLSESRDPIQFVVEAILASCRTEIDSLAREYRENRIAEIEKAGGVMDPQNMSGVDIRTGRAVTFKAEAYLDLKASAYKHAVISRTGRCTSTYYSNP